MPYFSAVFTIFSAILKRSSAEEGMPFSSRVRPTTHAPYFRAILNIVSIISAFPLTEFITAFPL